VANSFGVSCPTDRSGLMLIVTQSPAFNNVAGSNLIKKDILLVSSSAMLQFPMPLADRYVLEHRDDLETKDVLVFAD